MSEQEDKMDKSPRTRIYIELEDISKAKTLVSAVSALGKGLKPVPAFPKRKPNERALKRAKKRGTKVKVDTARYMVINVDDMNINVDEVRRLLLALPEVRSVDVEELPHPLYNPNDPDGLDLALTDQQLTHAIKQSGLDITMGSGIVIGLIEMPFWSAGADYTRTELGGTGDQAADWAAIQAGTHAKFDLYTDDADNPVDPFGTGHGDRTVPRCVAIADNNIDYLGTAPQARVMFAYQNDISGAITRLTDLGVDVISISYTGSWGRRIATQDAVSNGVVVVDAHANNTNAETEFPKPYEAINVGGYLQSDYSSARSWGIGLTLLATSTYGTTYESYATPTVAGAAALLLAQNPVWKPYDVHRALIQTAFKPAQMGADVFTRTHGWGLLRIHDALQLSLADLLPLPPVDVEMTILAGRVIEVTWTDRPITNYAGVRILGRLNEPPIAGAGNDLEIDIAMDINVAYIVPPASGNWYFAVLGKDTTNRYSEVLEYVQFAVEPYIYRCPKAPTINPVASPTTNKTVTLTGTKERCTALHIRGVEVVPLDDSENWIATVTLDPGGNLIPVTAVDEYGESSDPAYAFVDRQMYVRLAGDTMTGPLQLDNAGNIGGLKIRRNSSGLPEWGIKTSGESLIFIEHDDSDREVLRINDIYGSASGAIKLAALSGATLSAEQLKRLTQPAVIRRLKADYGTSVKTVTFGSPRKVLAFIAMTSSDPRHDHDRGDMYAADIFRINGNRTPGTYSYGGDHLGSSGASSNLLPSFYMGTVSTIEFRLRSFQNATVWAVAVVLSQP
jgi:hypothetical protein